MTSSSDLIAIIGLSCRFPQAENLEKFWNLLYHGTEAVTFFSDESLLAAGIKAEHLTHPDYVKATALLEGIELFDANFFNMPPREAEITDPQHRIFLECMVEALEMSGYNPDIYPGKIGVYAGCGLSSYLLNNIIANPETCQNSSHFQLLMGNNKDFMPSRASYKLNLTGPSLNISTACSTSLVAIHTACQSLLDYHCDIALSGGVSIQVPQQQGYFYEPAGISSPDGHCRAFDAQAQGTVSGNGAGVVTLKRLDDALTDGDTIHAVICASAVNNDGSDKVGYTAPSVNGQASVIAEAQAVADINPETIGFIEAHGTGTSLGDPIEIEALTQAFRMQTQKTGFCAIGSVKTNFGHLDEAAGIAGLIKTVLALKHRKIPASLHYTQPNPEINFQDSPFFVNQKLRDWVADGDNPLRAGVSSFGIGGTNAHLIIEQAPTRPASEHSQKTQLLILSAKTHTSLNSATANLLDYFKQNPKTNLADVSYTLKIGRKAYVYKRFIVCQSVVEAISQLQLSLQQNNDLLPTTPSQKCVFMFSGQGSQYSEMGHQLYQQETVFRQHFDHCAELLQPLLKLDLRSLCFSDNNSQQLSQTAIAQPLLFSFEYALAQLWISFGIKPQAMIGHSIGEYVAACLSHVFSLSDALNLVALRGRLMQQLPTGKMLAVSLPVAEIEPLLNADLAIAAVNEPQRTIISGTTEAVTALQQHLQHQQIQSQLLQTSHAFHSAMMEPIVDEFISALHKIDLKTPKTPYISNVSGTWITDEQATDPAYYARHLRQTVRFADGITPLLQDSQNLFLEIGPGRTLTGCVARHASITQSHTVVNSTRHNNDLQSDAHVLQTAIGKLWQAGYTISNWERFYEDERRYRIPLPTYAFERKRFWLEPSVTNTLSSPSQETKTVDIDSWFYQSIWQPAPTPIVAAKPALTWLILIDEKKHLEPLVEILRKNGHTVITAVEANSFNQLSANEFSLNPLSSEDYKALFSKILQQHGLPQRIVYSWCLTRHDAEMTPLHSLLLLIQNWTQNNWVANMTLAIITHNMQSVSGKDLLCPEQACMLGPVRVIPIEYPSVQCRSIDLDLTSRLDAKVVPQLYSELLVDQNQTIIAYRQNQRFIQTFESVTLNPEALPFKNDGVYLISGGFGSMGLVFAEHIAQQVNAQLILVGRHPPKINSEKPNADFSSAECEFVSELESNLRRSLAIKTLDHYDGLKASLNKLCADLIYYYFKTAAAIELDHLYLPKDLQQVLGIQPAFTKFYQFFLTTMLDNDLIQEQNGLLQFNHASPLTAEQLQLNFSSEHPDFKGLSATLAHCASHYGTALSGEIPAISVLYPDGTPALLDKNSAATAEYACDRIYLKLLAELLVPIAKARSQDKPLKILEVGGGTGGLTHNLLAAIKDCAITYHFTDIGQTFLKKARLEAEKQGYHQVSFSSFDISENALNQGFKENDYDVIVGYNVVHATPDIDASIANLLKLVTDGGLLCLVETVQQQNWDDMIWGLAEAWWCFNDHQRQHNTPILTLDQWENLFRNHTNVSVTSFPKQAELRQQSDTGLIIARRRQLDTINHDALSWLSPSTIEQQQLKKLAAIEALGSKLLCLQADVSNPAQMHIIRNQIHSRFGRIDGIIHCAGVLGQGLIREKTIAEVDRTLAAKFYGSFLLADLANDYKPDFFLLCSSMSSVLPIQGQFDYCAANAFLDAFASYNTQLTGVRTTAIDWGVWQELGMIEQAHSSKADKQNIRDQILSQNWNNVGTTILDHVLASNNCPSQIIVSPEDLRPPTPLHPLFSRVKHDSDSQSSYIGYYNERDYWLFDEHRLQEKATLPGTGYLELAHAAFSACNSIEPNATVELSAVYFLSPLILEQGEQREVRTVLQRRKTGKTDFFIVSKLKEDHWLQHARGSIYTIPTCTAPQHDLSALASLCTDEQLITSYRTAQPDEALTEFEERLKSYGPRWINLAWAKFGDKQSLAYLELPDEFASDTESYQLHPALLDIATGFLYIKREYGYLPFCYQRITFYGAIPSKIYSHVVANKDNGDGLLNYDIVIIDEEGKERVNINQYCLKPVSENSLTYQQIYGQQLNQTVTEKTPILAENFYLEINEPGVLDSLFLKPSLRRKPNEDEVEIEIAYVGLNFIEVLTALGLLEQREEIDFQQFGLECSGTIARVGENVTTFKVGDSVQGFCHAALSRYSTTPAYTISLKPEHLSLEQAATIPVAYATAYYALVIKGQLAKGERILIHAASGGVGMAAIHIAQWIGAEIYATAGTPEKRSYLQTLGVQHVLDSRSLSFATEINRITDGQGVNVVLNSLGGEFIPKSLEVLARYGRFLELGKRDFMQNTALGLEPFSKSLSFFALDIGIDLPDFNTLWQQLNRHFQAGLFPALPYHSFTVANIAQAFEYMAQAKHIGKVLIALDDLQNLPQLLPTVEVAGITLDAILGCTDIDNSSNNNTAIDDNESTSVLAVLTTIWRELLGIETIAADANFFALNGDSLLAAQVISRVHKHFRIALPMSAIFDTPTLDALAARIELLLNGSDSDTEDYEQEEEGEI